MNKPIIVDLSARIPPQPEFWMIAQAAPGKDLSAIEKQIITDDCINADLDYGCAVYTDLADANFVLREMQKRYPKLQLWIVSSKEGNGDWWKV